MYYSKNFMKKTQVSFKNWAWFLRGRLNTYKRELPNIFTFILISVKFSHSLVNSFSFQIPFFFLNFISFSGNRKKKSNKWFQWDYKAIDLSVVFYSWKKNCPWQVIFFFCCLFRNILFRRQSFKVNANELGMR